MAGVKVLMIGPLDLPTITIDGRRPFRELSRRRVAHCRMRYPADVTDADLRWAQVLVIVRAIEPDARGLLRAAQASGLKTIFSWDDDFFSIPKEDKANYAHYSSPAVRRSLEEILRSVDLVKASTPKIGEISRRYTDRVLVAPYGIDLSLVPQDLPARTDGRIRIGYFGAPGARGAEFDCVINALVRIQREHPEVDVEFSGFVPDNPDPRLRFVHFPYTGDHDASFQELAERQWDIGLAPLADNGMSQGKRATKYIDYGAVGVAGVYSDLSPYRDAVGHGERGLLTANTAVAWYNAIERLVRDPHLRRNIGEAACLDVEANFSLDVAVEAWADALRKVGYPVPRIGASRVRDKGYNKEGADD
jgi:glycosyltransferase involved in cell wall biosynthesis